jgi:hypothetical protein
MAGGGSPSLASRGFGDVANKQQKQPGHGSANGRAMVSVGDPDPEPDPLVR